MKIEFPINGEGSMPLLKPGDGVTTLDKGMPTGKQEEGAGCPQGHCRQLEDMET